MNCECKNYEWLSGFFTAEHHPLCVQNMPPKTVEDLITRMESIFELGTKGDTAHAETGEPFIAFGAGYTLTNLAMQNDVNGKIQEVAETTLLRVMWEKFLDYSANISAGKISGFKLYWRRKPIFQREDFSDAECVNLTLRTRFIVSNKPKGEAAPMPRMQYESTPNLK